MAVKYPGCLRVAAAATGLLAAVIGLVMINDHVSELLAYIVSVPITFLGTYLVVRFGVDTIQKLTDEMGL